MNSNEVEKPSEVKRSLKDILLPSYDECSIFLMTFTFSLLFLFNKVCRAEILSFYSAPGSADRRGVMWFVMITVLFLGGVALSFFHIFVEKEKDVMAETLMKFSAIVLNGIAGIACGVYFLRNDVNLLVLSPSWNIIMGILLLYQIGFVDSVNFDQKDASLSQIFVGILVCVVLFIFFNVYFKYYWALSFSIIVNYVVNMNHFISKGPAYLKGHFALTKLN